jgi:hypothetical protein
VFLEAFLQQIQKSMMHPDIDTPVGAHHMFSANVVKGPGHRSEALGIARLLPLPSHHGLCRRRRGDRSLA